MPDIVLGALIGVVSVALGAIITGIINYKQSKSQQKYNEQQACIDRLIKARETLLIPLREAISAWVECSHQVTNMIVRFKNALKEDEASPSRQLETKEFWEVMERGKQLSSQLRILCGQINDNILDKQIEALKNTLYTIEHERMPLVRFVNDPSGADINTLESALKEEESLRKKVWGQVLQVNKRIEELLSGEPST